MHSPHTDDDDLLKPNEAAAMFGVGTAALARWARNGMIPFVQTPAGSRRYRLSDVRALTDGAQPTIPEEQDREEFERDAVRLYEQGWSIRQVAERLDTNWSAMRRILVRRGVKLRERGSSRLRF